MSRIILTLLLIPLIFSSCDKTDDNQIYYDEDLISISAYLEDNKDNYSSFYKIVQEGRLSDPLSAYNPFGNGFTLFLPTDAAFESYIEQSPKYESFEELMEDTDFVRLLGRYHLVNIQMESNEFPYGALPDTTMSGDFLTIGFSTDLDSTVYKVNNLAPIISGNLEMTNGYVHVISQVLQPVNYSGYQWLKDNPDYSILAQALDITGLKDTLGIYRTTTSGQVVPNKYTILSEHDSIFQREGISDIDDLVVRYATPGLELTDPNNALYQFAAYHIMEGSYFLADLEKNGNYNTMANSPLGLLTGLEIKLNTGVDTFRLEIDEYQDTTYINYISIYYQESNILTKNGAVHFITEVLEYYTPGVATRTFQFYEEPEINAVRNTPGSYFFNKQEQDELEVISWIGPDFLLYYKSSSTSEPASNKDYLELEGNFKFDYTIPKILPGKYTVYIRAHGYNQNNEHATILVYLDDKRMGGSYNLNSGGQSASNPYSIQNNGNGYKVGSIEFTKYSEHLVTIETLIPGLMLWDWVRFVPE